MVAAVAVAAAPGVVAVDAPDPSPPSPPAPLLRQLAPLLEMANAPARACCGDLHDDRCGMNSGNSCSTRETQLLCMMMIVYDGI